MKPSEYPSVLHVCEPMTQLNSRRQAVLSVVVQEYISSAIPVGSRTVVETYGLQIGRAHV